MIFTKSKLLGAFIVDLESSNDDRGFFARAWCAKEFNKNGLADKLCQCNLSYNKKKGTLRGMHYQIAPYQEDKMVRCIRGAIYDLIIDLRKNSPTYKQWLGVELTAENHRMLYVPKGFAHGFITLEDDTEVFYQVSEFYTPNSERGIRYNDPAFNIILPTEIKIISDKDKNHEDWQE